MSRLAVLVAGLDFGEGPRWHDDRLWYSDFWQGSVFTVTDDGRREAVHTGVTRPSGLGWLPDGRLLVVSMSTREVLRDDGGTLVMHADLSDLTPWLCNDMVVAADGTAYVGQFGFDQEGGADLQGADLFLVRPDGSAEVAASDLLFPNGSIITPDGSTLIVGETFGGRYTAFPIEGDGSLGPRRRWAETPGMAPDGCSLDEAGGIWFADPAGAQVVRITEGGAVTDQVPTPLNAYACALGGPDGTTLFVVCAPDAGPGQAGTGSGAIYQMPVDVPHAGLP
jgi:sugar lactone lactonase YvrE